MKSMGYRAYDDELRFKARLYAPKGLPEWFTSAQHGMSCLDLNEAVRYDLLERKEFDRETYKIMKYRFK